MATLLFVLTIVGIALAALIHEIRGDGLGRRPAPRSHVPDQFDPPAMELATFLPEGIEAAALAPEEFERGPKVPVG